MTIIVWCCRRIKWAHTRDRCLSPLQQPCHIRSITRNSAIAKGLREATRVAKTESNSPTSARPWRMDGYADKETKKSIAKGVYARQSRSDGERSIRPIGEPPLQPPQVQSIAQLQNHLDTDLQIQRLAERIKRLSGAPMQAEEKAAPTPALAPREGKSRLSREVEARQRAVERAAKRRDVDNLRIKKTEQQSSARGDTEKGGDKQAKRKFVTDGEAKKHGIEIRKVLHFGRDGPSEPHGKSTIVDTPAPSSHATNFATSNNDEETLTPAGSTTEALTRSQSQKLQRIRSGLRLALRTAAFDSEEKHSLIAKNETLNLNPRLLKMLRGEGLSTSLTKTSLGSNKAAEEEVVQVREYKTSRGPLYRRSAAPPNLDLGNETDDLPMPILYSTAASILIPGMRPVMAALVAKRRKLYKLWLAGQAKGTRDRYESNESNKVMMMAKAMGIPTDIVEKSFLDNMARKLARHDGIAPLHDGVILDASPLPRVPVKSLGFNSKHGEFFDLELDYQTKEDADINGTPERLPYQSNGWRRPFLLWLHGVVDTGNIGALARTAFFFGVDAIILSTRGTGSFADTNSQKASTGATEHLTTLTVSDPSTFITSSQVNGWIFYSAVAPPKDPTLAKGNIIFSERLDNQVSSHSTVLVLGNEDLGLPPSISNLTKFQMTLSGHSKVAREKGLDSLNVSVAGALLMQRFLREPR